MSAHISNTEILQAAFPGRTSLTPEEVARTICKGGKATKKQVERIRKMLDQGVLVPRLRKVGARWDIPIAALGAAMDARVPPASRDITPSTGRRSLKSTIGPRMLFRQEKAREVYALILNEVKRLQAEVARIDLEAKTPSAQRTTRRAEPSGRI